MGTKKKPARSAPQVGDAAVKRATGRDWKGWVRVLREAGAGKMSHAEIARLLHSEYGLSAWWAQTVTVGYERLTGRRARHQVVGGYQVSVTRTIRAPMESCDDALRNARSRRAWLPEKITMRPSSEPAVARFAWADGSDIEVRLTPKAPDRTQIAVQARKLTSAKAAAGAKRVWRDRLERLGAQVAGGSVKRAR